MYTATCCGADVYCYMLWTRVVCILLHVVDRSGICTSDCCGLELYLHCCMLWSCIYSATSYGVVYTLLHAVELYLTAGVVFTLLHAVELCCMLWSCAACCGVVFMLLHAVELYIHCCMLWSCI